MTKQDEIRGDQAHFDVAWEARERKRANLSHAGSAAGGPSKTAAAVRRAGERHAASLGSPDDPVAFGRYDRDGERVFIGYHLINDDNRDPLVINWQTPAAEPFYKATVQTPLGLSRKRTYDTKNNQILNFSDVLFAQLAEAVAELSGPEQWGIDDALLRDLEAGRTGEMQDIVQTIHASQNDLIRSDLEQTLIIQGGPGTGKTAIALHRISWILYNYSQSISPSDCLVVGPNPTFTRYINAVLPGLGNHDVAYRDLRSLGPVKSQSRHEASATSRLKGEARMADLLRRALWQRVGFPDRSDRLTIGPDSLGPSFGRDEIEAEIAKHSARSYNAGRNAMRQYLQMEARKRSRANVDVSAAAVENALERVWPQATAASFLREFLGSRDRLLSAAEGVTPELTVSEIRSLQRTPSEKVSNESWSDADVPLLDELDHLLGNQSGTYSHIVVDEAQDLSPMQLRSIRRRSRNGSMTVVGDIAQSTSVWARDSWSDVASALTVDVPCTVHELSLGYRVPQQVFEFAAQLLPVAAPRVTPPRVVRAGPAEPELIEVLTDDLVTHAVDASRRHAGDGRFVGLICPDSLRDQIISEFVDRDVVWADVRNGELGKSINLASPEESKGLEFDAVVVVQPEEIVRSAPRGHRLLYVALTRTTMYLTVIHDGVAMPTDRPLNDHGMGSVVHTVDEPPTDPQEVVTVELTSVVTNGHSAESAAIVAPSPLPPSELVTSVKTDEGSGGEKTRSSGATDRVVCSIAESVASDVRDSLLPAKYAPFVDALRRELSVTAEDLLEFLD